MSSDSGPTRSVRFCSSGFALSLVEQTTGASAARLTRAVLALAGVCPGAHAYFGPRLGLATGRESDALWSGDRGPFSPGVVGVCPPQRPVVLLMCG